VAGERAVLGRKGADLVLSDPKVTRRHALIERRGERYWIRDLGARGGLEVAGRAAQDAVLEHLTEVRVGGTVLVAMYGLEQAAGGLGETYVGPGAGEEGPPSAGSGADRGRARGAAPAPPSAYLLVVQGPERGKAYSLKEETTVLGRSPDEADLWVQDPLVSRRHARIVRTASGFRLEDLASAHGTSRNGETVTKTDLRDGDVVGLAGTHLLFLLGEERLRQETEKLRR